MKTFIIMIMSTTITCLSAQSERLDFSAVKDFEHQLEDVMELIDTVEVKNKLLEAEEDFHHRPSEINKLRLGIIYHETALNLSFLTSSEYKGYARRSYDILSELAEEPATTPELLPFILSYRASALSLVGAETKKLKLIGESFALFDDAVNRFSEVSYLPFFLRGSVAENLPWFFLAKKKYAKRDFEEIIARHNQNENYANPKIMSFTFWAWANGHKARKYREQALSYLNKAIALDPQYNAGRKRAEELKAELTN